MEPWVKEEPHSPCHRPSGGMSSLPPWPKEPPPNHLPLCLDPIASLVATPGRSDTSVLTAASDLSSELEPQPRDRANTWPTLHPGHSDSSLASDPVPTNPSGSKKKGKSGGSEPASAAKKPNPWGDESYAELIARAIASSPAQRMKLSEIYGWFVENNAYFAERKDVEAAAGWKNSIRHNLSLHSRFMRIQNEGAGKSSWWVINPDAKPGKASRRRAQTMDAGKVQLKEKKKRVRAKVEALRRGPDSAVLSPAISESSDGFYDQVSFGPLGEFRDRSGSNLSNYSIGSGPAGGPATGRLSPQLEELEDWKPGVSLPSLGPDLLDMATKMRLEAGGNGGFPGLQPALRPPPYSAALAQARFGPGLASPIKAEPGMGGCGLPAYQELYPPGAAASTNPLLRDVKPFGTSGLPMYGNGSCSAAAAFPVSVFSATSLPTAFPSPAPAALPSDISDIHPYRPADTAVCDVESVLRYEMNCADGKPLDFNMDSYQN